MSSPALDALTQGFNLTLTASAIMYVCVCVRVKERKCSYWLKTFKSSSLESQCWRRCAFAKYIIGLLHSCVFNLLIFYENSNKANASDHNGNSLGWRSLTAECSVCYFTDHTVDRAAGFIGHFPIFTPKKLGKLHEKTDCVHMKS